MSLKTRGITFLKKPRLSLPKVHHRRRRDISTDVTSQKIKQKRTSTFSSARRAFRVVLASCSLPLARRDFFSSKVSTLTEKKIPSRGEKEGQHDKEELTNSGQGELRKKPF